MVDVDEVRDLPISGLAKQLDHDMEEWFLHTTKELPETLRINSLRADRDWTREQVEVMGAKALSWYPDGWAYTMPWLRGETPDEFRDLYIKLHETGRTTRQESASMLPVIALAPQKEEKILDMCASPGSKSTQLSEMMEDTGLVVANDVSSGRLNTLVTNRGRVSIANMMLTRHDGRHFPAVPDPGFDAVLVDAPCSGSGTLRKNKHVWWDWKESSGLSLRRLQLDILRRACALLKPDGRLVYSTCSFDPIENEGIINQILEENQDLELQKIDVESVFPGLKSRQGLSNWKTEKFNWNNDLLKRCIRIAPEDNDSSGFFLALLHLNSTEKTAKAMAPKFPISEMKVHDQPRQDARLPSPCSPELIDEVCKQWDIQESEKWSWWQRGKKIAISTPMARQWLWDSPRTLKRRSRLPGGHWHPINAIHAGTTAFQSGKSGMRPRSEAVPLLINQIHSKTKIEKPLMHRLLMGEEPLIEELEIPEMKNYTILYSEETDYLPIWAGQRLSLMVGDSERYILALQAGLQPDSSSSDKT
ncbi:MAG TPA: RsmB/NOP family class I SAM-dependent RNA methyltransferase [Candidatus Poseidoniales archaeon]|jgi:NOL1/NOP2/sun family putative RNA methylase|nr:MAG: hypothetical protein CXT68_04955 [Euryarchaeota archaeon]HIF16042.1 RsmB/NOP family class I SAM-dependent RNA methyltransferase [Candidatus Poseidoniales archaeon]